MSAPLRRPRPATRAGGLVLLVALGALLGCGPSTEPVRWPADPERGIPAVDWPVGAPDLSDEWVAGLVEAQVALAAAANAHDFSSPHLADLVDPEELAFYARYAAANADQRPFDEWPSIYSYYPGPQPMQIREVEVEGDRATVETCEPSDWATSESVPVTVKQVADTKRGFISIYTLRRGSDGQVVLVDGDFPARGCELGAPRVGLFDPPPPFGAPVLYTEVIGPDGGLVDLERGDR